MKAPFSLFLALRYLKPKRTFVSIITVFSILGVTLGIMVLIVVMSVMTGFGEELRRKVLGFEAHILVTTDGVLSDWRDLIPVIEKNPNVTATAPFVQGPVIAEFQGRRLAPKIRGIDPEKEQRVTDIRSAIKEGEFDLSGDKVIVGIGLARQLGVAVGDYITVYSPGNISEILAELEKAEKNPGEEKTMQELREMVLPADLLVSGIFETARSIQDTEYMLVPLHIGQELYGLEDNLHGIVIRTKDPYQAPAVKNELLLTLPPYLAVDTWMDMNQQIFAALRMEKTVMFIILMFIVLVAAFSVMNTLITVTVQKRREIGIMKALGATTSQIVWIFLAQGMIVGIFGNLCGLGAGMFLVTWRNDFKSFLENNFGIEVFPSGIYQFNQIPAQIVPSDVAVICISAFVICSVAALIPAYFAARLDPVKALRYE